METPTQEIVRRANTPDAIKDSKGRTLQVLRLQGSALSKFLLFSGDGNGTWLGATLMRASVRQIDDLPISMPTTLDQAHRLWDLVDADAAEAALTHFTEQDGASTTDAAKN